MDYRNVLQDVLKQEAEAILNIPIKDSFNNAIELIYEQVHIKGGKVVTSGMGKAGYVAKNLAVTFSSNGTPSVFLHPSEAQHGDLGLLSPNDVLILFSNSGKTREIEELIVLTKNLYDTIPMILVTGNENGEISDDVNVIISTGHPDEVCPLGLTPTTSKTVMSVIGDALDVAVSTKINFTKLDYSKRHHGGYLGQKSKE